MASGVGDGWFGGGWGLVTGFGWRFAAVFFMRVRISNESMLRWRFDPFGHYSSIYGFLLTKF